MEKTFFSSDEKFKLLAENLPGTVFLCRNDEHYTVIYLNNNIEALTGYTSDQFFKGTIKITEIIHEEDRHRVEAVIQKALAGKTSYHMQYRILHRSGGFRWVEETGVGVYYNEEPVLIEGYVTDITERKAAEDELARVAEENFRVFNNTLNLNVIAGFDGYFKQLNPAWEQTLGWSLDELKAKKFKEFIHPDDRESTDHALQLVVSGTPLSAFENRYRCKDGSYRWLLWSTSPDIARALMYASVIDITDRKKSEEALLLSKKNLEAAALELEEHNRQLDEFAHIISHNLRSPVGNINALINFIDENSTMKDYQLIFEKITNVASNLNETMNDLLETLKVKKNADVERVEIRFKEVLDKTIQSLEGELIQSGTVVTYNFNEAPKIYYSKHYLESIFQNLISNAIKYRSPERTLKIHLQSSLSTHGVELCVSDNGLGIDLEKFGPKIFGLHKTFHGNKEARGVGLFLTKMQVEALGGTIQVESKVNAGSVFIIKF